MNLFLSASRKTGDIVHDLRSRMVRQGNKYVFEGSVIVYCPTKKATEDIQSVLTSKWLLMESFYSEIPQIF